MVTVDLSLMGLLKGNFFNFLTVFSLVVLLLIKLDVASKLEFAKNKIVELINKSEEEKLLSEKDLEFAKIEVQNLPDELNKIKADAQNTVDSYKKSVKVEMEKIEQKLNENAQKIIDNEVLRINNSLQKELAHDAVLMAHNKTLEALKNDMQLHRKFINEAIDKIEEVEI